MLDCSGNSKNDFALNMTFLRPFMRLSRIGKRIGAIHNHANLSAIKQVCQLRKLSAAGTYLGSR
jgi:hypothetical protein